MCWHNFLEEGCCFVMKVSLHQNWQQYQIWNMFAGEDYTITYQHISFHQRCWSHTRVLVVKRQTSLITHLSFLVSIIFLSRVKWAISYSSQSTKIKQVLWRNCHLNDQLLKETVADIQVHNSNVHTVLLQLLFTYSECVGNVDLCSIFKQTKNVF